MNPKTWFLGDTRVCVVFIRLNDKKTTNLFIFYKDESFSHFLPRDEFQKLGQNELKTPRGKKNYT